MVSWVRSSSTSIVLESILLLLSMILTPRSASATLVWSDTVNDGDYEGRTVTHGLFSCSGNSLIATELSSAIHHPSSVMVGTWSFDLLLIDQGSSGVHVCFCCEAFMFDPITGYDLKASQYGFELVIWKMLL